MTELHWLSATELAAAYRSGNTSPTELVEALLTRIDSLDPHLHAFVFLDVEGARAAARTAETEMRAGDWRGPLHGIPVGFKDNIDVAGMPTTCQSRLLLGNIAQRDAGAVAALRRAGAIIFGKMTTFEFAVTGPSETPFPIAANPWNLGHDTGGSSAGSAVGLAGGLLPLAVGTDTGGSVRNPAGGCGIVGLKPTYGRVPTSGVFPLAYSLDCVGPMARRVADVANMLSAMSVPQHTDAVGLSGGALETELSAGLGGLRVGFVRHFHETDAPADPEVIASLQQAAKVMAAEGATVTNITLPPLEQFSHAQHVIMTSEGFAVHAPWMRERPADYTQMVRRRLLTGAFFTATEYLQAQRVRTELSARVAEVMREVDVLLVANLAEPAQKIGGSVSMSRDSDQKAWSRRLDQQYRAPFSLTRLPSVAVMTGLSASGLPLSMQLVGRHGEDAVALRAAAAYERATEWHRLRPTGVAA